MKPYLLFFVLISGVHLFMAQPMIFRSQNYSRLIPPPSETHAKAIDFSTSLQNYAFLPPVVNFSGDFTAECRAYPTACNHWSRIIVFGNGANYKCVLLVQSLSVAITSNADGNTIPSGNPLTFRAKPMRTISQGERINGNILI